MFLNKHEGDGLSYVPRTWTKQNNACPYGIIPRRMLFLPSRFAVRYGPTHYICVWIIKGMNGDHNEQAASFCLSIGSFLLDSPFIINWWMHKIWDLIFINTCITADWLRNIIIYNPSRPTFGVGFEKARLGINIMLDIS